MNPSRTTLLIILGGVIVVLISGGLLWYIFQPAATNTPTTTTSFGSAANTPVSTTVRTTTTTETPTSSQSSNQKVFQIASGPIAGATIVQTLHPTTTIARYVMQDTGHVLDVVIDSPGSVARSVSNTTIPGVVRAIWMEGGAAAVLQYMDGTVVKTLYMRFPSGSATSSSASTASKIKFLPDNVADIAASPDGLKLVYLLKTNSGVDGYTAQDDGTGGKKLFSLPFSEVLVSWPSQSTIIAQTKSSAGVTGVAFTIDAKSGAAVLLLSTTGLTVTADRNFTHILYQNRAGSAPLSYVRDVKKGTNKALSFSPYPEKCVWSSANLTLLYCATPLTYNDSSYLDLWHQGAASANDSVVAFNSVTGQSYIIATPGSDGGVGGDTSSIALSPDDHYLTLVARGDHTLWGVRVTQ